MDTGLLPEIRWRSVFFLNSNLLLRLAPLPQAGEGFGVRVFVNAKIY